MTTSPASLAGLLRWITVLVVTSLVSLGQGVPGGQTSIALIGFDQRDTILPANTAATYLDFVGEQDSLGLNFFDIIVENPSVVVSLVIPSSVEVTSANASGLGYSYEVFTDPIEGAEGTQTSFALPGKHIIIGVPASQPSGTYRIKADTTGIGSPSGILAFYYPSSAIQTGALVGSDVYAVGDTVVLAGIIKDAGSAVTGSTVTAVVKRESLVNSRVSFSYTLLDDESVGEDLTEYTYSVTLTNSGGALSEPTARLRESAEGVEVVSLFLGFNDVAASSNGVSTQTLVLRRDPALSFNPTSLEWDTYAGVSPFNVSLTDTALSSPASDGGYKGSFTATDAGEYIARVNFTGTTGGVNYSRTAVVRFEVVAEQLAEIVSVDDYPSGDGVEVQAIVNVEQEGPYSFDLTLQASNQKRILASTGGILSEGPQELYVYFPKSDLYSLGVNGPYDMVDVKLVFRGKDPKVVALEADAGPTDSYNLDDFAPPLRFTDTHTAVGVPGAGMTYDYLRVTMGIHLQAEDDCTWSAVLSDSAYHNVASASGQETGLDGAESLTLDFPGYLLERAANGPYAVRDVRVTCANAGTIRKIRLFQTDAFSASQFTEAAADFSFTPRTSPAPASQGSTSRFTFFVTPINGFNGDIGFSVTGLPTGAAHTFLTSVLKGGGLGILDVTTLPGTTVDTYTVTITATSGAVSHQIQPTLQVTQAVAAGTPQFSLAGGTYTGTQYIGLTTSTAGAKIYYTTDGNTPTTSSTLFVLPYFTIPASVTIKAIAVKQGFLDSAVASATYTIQ